MLLFRDGREFRWQQLPWIVLAGLILVGLGGWFFAVGLRSPDWPGGGTPVGLWLGFVGGGLIVFEVLLSLRKRIRSWRRILFIPIGRARIWLAGHIWLGLITLPLLIFHSGFRLGEALATTLMLLLIVVVLSGIFGLVLQQVLPKRMLDEVPSETIYSQIDRILGQTLGEARQLVGATCGTPAPPSTWEDPDEAESAGRRVLGAARASTMEARQILADVAPPTPVSEPKPLLEFFEERLVPYLERGQRSDSPLRYPTRTEFLFKELKAKLEPAAHPVVEQLQHAVDLRRQLDRQARTHRWLHGWLLVHVPLSMALLVLMFVHMYFATRYW